MATDNRQKHTHTQRHFNVYRSSKAQMRTGKKAQGFDVIVGRMHGWTYFEILTVFLTKGTKG